MHAGKYLRAAAAGARPVYRKSGQRDRRAQREASKPKRKIASYERYIRERWRARLESDRDRKRRKQRAPANSAAIGEWDLEVSLALRFNWTPEQIGRFDPDYLEELIARLSAETDLEMLD